MCHVLKGDWNWPGPIDLFFGPPMLYELVVVLDGLDLVVFGSGRRFAIYDFLEQLHQLGHNCAK